MGHHFVSVDRSTPFLLPPSLQEWLPQEHLARFVVEVVEQLDLSPLESSYAGRGSKAYHPGMLLAMLFYGYATGVFSSRKLEAATFDSIAFRYICANEHPDHDTIAAFRRRFMPELRPLFTAILVLAGEMGFLKLGTISLDGTKECIETQGAFLGSCREAGRAATARSRRTACACRDCRSRR